MNTLIKPPCCNPLRGNKSITRIENNTKYNNVATHDTCYDTAESLYYSMCDDYGRSCDEIDEAVLKSILQDWVDEAMALPIEKRHTFLTENIEAGFY